VCRDPNPSPCNTNDSLDDPGHAQRQSEGIFGVDLSLGATSRQGGSAPAANNDSNLVEIDGIAQSLSQIVLSGDQCLCADCGADAGIFKDMATYGRHIRAKHKNTSNYVRFNIPNRVPFMCCKFCSLPFCGLNGLSRHEPVCASRPPSTPGVPPPPGFESRNANNSPLGVSSVGGERPIVRRARRYNSRAIGNAASNLSLRSPPRSRHTRFANNEQEEEPAGESTAATAISAAAVDRSADFIGLDDDIDAIIEMSHKFGKPLHLVSHH